MSIDSNGLVANIYQGGEATGSVIEAAGIWQQYTYSFTATDNSTQVSFLFRQDPAFWAFDDVSVTAPESSTNLIVNPGFEDGGAPSNSAQPANWSLIGTPGLYAGGELNSGGANSGSYDWYDGAVDGFDGLAQTITTTPGVTYTLSFSLLTTSTLSGTEAPTTSPDSSSEVEQFLAYAGSLPAGFTVTPPTPPPGAPTVATIDGNEIATDANNTPVIAGVASSGTATGSTITIYVDGNQVGTAVTTDSAGDWTFTPLAPLAGGSHAITATETTGNGTSDQSATYNLDIVAAPTVTGVDGVGRGLDNNNLPAIIGTAAGPIGTTVTVYDGATAIGSTVTTDANGDWSFTPTTALTDGTHTLTATETVGSVTSSLSSPYSVTIDTTPSPSPVALTLDPASDSGVAGDDLTNVTSPVIDGTATPGDTVSLYDGETPVGTAIVGVDGTWSVTTTVLANGPHTLTAVDTDPAGNASAPSSSLTVTIDTTVTPAPIALTLDPASDTGLIGDDLTSDNTPAITGTGTAGDTVTLYDGETAVGSATVGEDGKWSVTTTTLADGAHTLTAHDTNPAGNVSELSDPLVVTIDTMASPAPIALTLDPASDSGIAGDDITNDNTPVIDGTATPGDTVTLYDGNTLVGMAAVGEDGSWSVTTSTLADGAHTLTAVDTDPAGNASAPSTVLDVTINTATPSVIAVNVSNNDGTLNLGQSVAFTLFMSEPVTLIKGVPTLTLSNGEVAIYDPTNSTPNELVFDYAVAAGDDTTSLTISSVSLADTELIDSAGNGADLSAAASIPIGALAVVTGFHPFSTLVASNPDPNEIVTVQVSLQPNIAGTYTHLGIGSMEADGVTYTATGTPAQVNAALAEVLLSPVSGILVSGSAVSATITDQDQTSSSELDNIGSLGSTLYAATAGDVVKAGSGADTLTAYAAGNTLIGGPGNDYIIGSTLGSTLIGGPGSSTFFSEGGNTVITGGGPNDVIAALEGDVTVTTSSAGNSLVALSTGTSALISQGNDTIFGGSGSAIISATGASTLFYQGAGPSVFLGGSGSSTVIGGSNGGSYISGGSGGGMFGGGSGGDNIIIGGLQSSTIFGGGNGDVLYSVGSAGTTIAAGSGNETLQGGYSSGNDVLFGGPGNDLVGLGSGSDVFFAGSGSSTVVAGVGPDILAFVNGRSGGSEFIIGFKTGTDSISLQDYAGNAAQQALQTATTMQATNSSPASTTLTLADNTKIVFENMTSVDQRVFG